MALKEVAGVLSSTLLASDLVARLGGDEFCALLVGAASEAGPTLISRVEGTLAARNAESGQPWKLSLSLGVGESPPSEQKTLWDVVGEADAAMFAAKRAKKVGRPGRR